MIAASLRAARAERKLSQAAAAELFAANVSTYRKWENGARPPAEVLDRMRAEWPELGPKIDSASEFQRRTAPARCPRPWRGYPRKHRFADSERGSQ